MPFRAKMKKAFGRSSSGSNSPVEGTTTPNGHAIEYYKPGEVPRSKYRGPWNQEHQDKLHAFDFSFGSNSNPHGSDYSPAQTRAQSRRSSWMSLHRRPSTNGSVSAGSTKSGKHSVRGHSRIGQVPEAEGDDDVMNVGVSRVNTRSKRGLNFGNETSSDEDNELEHRETVELSAIQHEHDRPFTEDELSKALTAATLKA